MKTPAPVADQSRQGGFVLATSLIFLVIVTLLAVSAINSSTIQERMASNQREKSRARQAADATLRHAEQLFQDSAFDTPLAAGTILSINPADNEGTNSGSISVKIWPTADMLADDADQDAPESFLLESTWADGKPLSYTVDDEMPPVEYYVEDYGCVGRDLNPDSKAVCDGTMMYRQTARARGQNPAAIAVTQSFYEKHY